jgi:hypothetical protein
VLTAIVAFIAGDNLLANLIGFKLIETVFFLGALPLVYRLAERLRPGSGAFALIAFAWNPLVLWSGPLDGHNDIVMVFFVLAGFYEMTAKRYETAIPLLFLGALTKYTALLVLPVILIHAYRNLGRRSLVSLAFGLAAGLALSVAVWLPFWDGPQTLGVLRESTAKTVQTPIAALLVMLNADRQSVLEVPAPFRLGFTAAFLACAACILFASFRSPDAGLRTAVLAALAIFVAYLYLGLWWFWPQYITWLLPLAAVLRSRVALSSCSTAGGGRSSGPIRRVTTWPWLPLSLCHQRFTSWSMLWLTFFESAG